MAENNNDTQLVTFQLGQEHYGIDIMEVREIVKMQEVRDIPNAPSFVEGIFNLRGTIIPIINLHKRFHIKKADLNDDEQLLSGFIILRIDDMELGVIIDKVLRVVTIDANQIQQPPQMISGIGAEYIQGVYNEQDNYLIIVDVKKLFNPKEFQQIKKMQ